MLLFLTLSAAAIIIVGGIKTVLSGGGYGVLNLMVTNNSNLYESSTISTVCLQMGNTAADNINQRAAGYRDTIAGKKGTDRLTGQGGWTEAPGCPVYTNDQADLANQQMADTFTANPNLGAFILLGGWAQFAPQAYAQVTDQVMPKLKSQGTDHRRRRHAAAADRRAEGRTQPCADRSAPLRNGLSRSDRHDRADRRQEGCRSGLHRPRRMHGRKRRDLPREVTKIHTDMGAGARCPLRYNRPAAWALSSIGRGGDIERSLTAHAK